jgi:hypothetical protein
MPNEECRIAKLEANHDTFTTEFKEYCRRAEIDSKERLELLLEVRDKQVKMAGFIAGITFAITAIASLGGVLINKFFSS